MHLALRYLLFQKDNITSLKDEKITEFLEYLVSESTLLVETYLTEH
jgi:hypothetical protein